MGQPEQHADGPHGRLRVDARAGLVGLGHELEDLPVEPLAGDGLGEAERHRPAGRAADLGQDPDLGDGALRGGAVLGPEHRRGLEHAAPVAAEHAGQGQELVEARERAGDRLSVGPRVEDGAARGEAEGAGGHGLLDQLDHLGEVLGGRVRVEGPVAHDVAAQRAVADHAADVEALRPAVELGQVLAVGLPLPREAAHDGVGGDVLDGLHHLGEAAAVLGPARGEGDAAVADDHRGHAVEARRGAQRVPRDLGVEVGVDVDEAGGDEPAGGIDGARRRPLHGADVGDHAVGDGNVGADRRCSGPVDHGPSGDDDIVHGGCSWPVPGGSSGRSSLGPSAGHRRVAR